jgi:hypothetical protein
MFSIMMYGFLANKDLAVCSTLLIGKLTSGHDLNSSLPVHYRTFCLWLPLLALKQERERAMFVGKNLGEQQRTMHDIGVIKTILTESVPSLDHSLKIIIVAGSSEYSRANRTEPKSLSCHR